MSLEFIRQFSTESPSEPFSNSRDNPGAELKEEAAQPLLGRPPPKPPDPALAGLEIKTDREHLTGRTIPRPASGSPARVPQYQRSISLEAPGKSHLLYKPASLVHYQKSECETTRNVSIHPKYFKVETLDSEVATRQDGNCKQQQVPH